MVILTTVWVLFESNTEHYVISENGGSIMIHDICEYIGRRETSYVFLGAQKTEDFLFGNIHILNNQKYLPDSRSDENIMEWQNGLQKRFYEILLELKPDIVLIQGDGAFSENCINICIECNQIYAFVDHSYFGKGNEDYDKGKMPEWEEQIFSIPDIHVVMVGNGMRNKMLNEYPDFPKEKIYVIPNGTHYKGQLKEDTLSRKYNLSEKKVLVCVGRIYKRKNQVQLTRLFKYLPNEIRDRLLILICGREPVRIPGMEDLQKAIRDERVEDKVICIGTRDEDGMKELYSVADGLIMPSISEGLSLVALEILTYGKPLIMFSDNETAVDVNDECAVVLAEDRSDQALADAVVKWYYNDWDEHRIKQYAERFSMERVAYDYINYCRQRIEEESEHE